MYTVLIIIGLIVLCGFLYASQTAFLALNEKKIRLLAETGDHSAIALSKQFNKTTKNVSALIAGGLVCQLAAAALSLYYFYPLLNKRLALANDLFRGALGGFSSAAIIILIFAFVQLTFARLLPQRIGLKNKESVAFKTIPLVSFMRGFFAPFNALSSGIANWIVRSMGIDPSELNSNITEEEIRLMVDAGEETGEIDENEKEMINNIFEFDNKTAEDIATHRTDITALPITASFEEIKEIINTERFSRIPVYEENIDDIIGIVHIKGLAKAVINNPTETAKNGIDLKAIMREPYFVPVSKKTDELFEEMQRTKTHMAVVIDEYGGTMGIVTMEDLLEEIVGNIMDEYDNEEEDIEITGSDEYLIRGTTDLDEVEEILGIPLVNEDYDTLSGLLIGCLGYIPEEEETPSIEIEDYIFTVQRIEEKRIEAVRVKKK